MQTIGHHTCSNKNGRAYIEKNAPFLSEYNPTENKLQFLGTGYYFWDYNLELAHYWGKSHYRNNYFIIESSLNMPEGLFLDLVGNRKHLIYFYDLTCRIESEVPDRTKWTIGAFIEHMKRLDKKIPGIFPFKVIRAIDHSAKPKKESTFNFVEGKANFININPRLVICLTEKNELFLRTKAIVFES